MSIIRSFHNSRLLNNKINILNEIERGGEVSRNNYFNLRNGSIMFDHNSVSFNLIFSIKFIYIYVLSSKKDGQEKLKQS